MAPGAPDILIPAIGARRVDEKGRGAVAVSLTGSTAAPSFRDPAATPRRAPRALVGFFPGLASATKFVSAWKRVPPDRLSGRGRGEPWPALRAITFLAGLIGLQRFSVRLFEQDAESDHGLFYGPADVDSAFISFRVVAHETNHEGLECGLLSEHQRTLQEQHAEKFFGAAT